MFTKGQDALTSFAERESVHLLGKSIGIPWPGRLDLVDEALFEMARSVPAVFVLV